MMNQLSEAVAEIPSRRLAIGGRLLARNSFWSFCTQGVPLLLAILLIPFIVSRLGTSRFGLLSLWWVLLGSTSIADLGLGRATTMFVAESLASPARSRLTIVVWTSIVLQLILGLLAGLLMATLVPVLVHRILKTPEGLVHEAQASFVIVAALFAVALPTASLRGVLEATQRFDLVSLVKAPLNAAMFVLPALALLMHRSLVGIALLLGVALLFSALGYLFLCLRILPELRHFSWPTREVLTALARYGGWVTVSNLVSPILAYIDRFFVGSIVGLSAMAYYTAPYDAVTRLWILPNSMATTLFPAFSALQESSAQKRRSEIYQRSLKYLLFLMGPVVLFIVVFSDNLLRIWLGTAFAEKSSVALQILALGVLVNSIGWVPFSLLQGLGRPDVTAKFHLFELALQVGLVWFCVSKMGIVGAAVAWTLRVCLDSALVFAGCQRLHLANLCLKDAVTLFGLVCLIASALPFVWLGIPRGMVVVILALVFVAVAWCFLLSVSERKWLVGRFSRLWLFRGGYAT
jgi:O-antigen/teichoic acid export membrane protein